jgi:FAD/FMN-containing dehydrogenase
MTDLLIRDFDGVLIHPEDEGYDAARSVWNAIIDRRPALIARCMSVADVVAAVRYGREAGLEIGVRGGGHSFLGLPVVEGGLMIDLSGLAAVRVDPGSRRAWVGGGALLGALDIAAQRFGLATTAGNVSHTGVGGLTLGGGTGWLARLHGLTCDNVASYQLVTADGAVLRVAADEHPDLFWALRGGGGNFGIVTEFEFRLHPIGTQAYVSDFYYDLKEARTALRGWRDLFVATPRQATPVARVGRWEEFGGRPMASIGFVWVGDPAEARRLRAQYAAIGRPAAERSTELSYLELQMGDDDIEQHAMRRYCKGLYLRELPNQAIDAFLDQTSGVSARLALNGGAIADVPAGASAYSHRDALVEFTSSAGWTDPTDDDHRITTVRNYAAALNPFASGSYVNTISDPDDGAIRRAYSPPDLTRLATIKRRYDPTNVFRHTLNIQP